MKKHIQSTFSKEDVIRKSVSLDKGATDKLKDIREHFKKVYNMGVSDTSIIRRSIALYHEHMEATAAADGIVSLDELDSMFKAAQPHRSSRGWAI